VFKFTDRSELRLAFDKIHSKLKAPKNSTNFTPKNTLDPNTTAITTTTTTTTDNNSDQRVKRVFASTTGELFKCKKCDCKFSHAGNLWRHNKLKHDNNTMSHVCNTCGKKFPFAHTLKLHMRKHTGG
jgi:uncharacterized Zn-finger protein